MNNMHAQQLTLAMVKWYNTDEGQDDQPFTDNETVPEPTRAR